MREQNPCLTRYSGGTATCRRGCNVFGPVLTASGATGVATGLAIANSRPIDPGSDGVPGLSIQDMFSDRGPAGIAVTAGAGLAMTSLLGPHFGNAGRDGLALAAFAASAFGVGLLAGVNFGS